MKRNMLLALAVALFAVGFTPAAETKSNDQKFYGKVTLLEPGNRSFTAFNKSRQEDAKFTWDDQTLFTKDKNPVKASTLENGQFLSVSFEEEGNLKKATKVSIRPAPFKKKAQQ